MEEERSLPEDGQDDETGPVEGEEDVGGQRNGDTVDQEDASGRTWRRRREAGLLRDEVRLDDDPDDDTAPEEGPDDDVQLEIVEGHDDTRHDDDTAEHDQPVDHGSPDVLRGRVLLALPHHIPSSETVSS